MASALFEWDFNSIALKREQILVEHSPMQKEKEQKS